jgi:hypothetical protein
MDPVGGSSPDQRDDCKELDWSRDFTCQLDAQRFGYHVLQANFGVLRSLE